MANKGSGLPVHPIPPSSTFLRECGGKLCPSERKLSAAWLPQFPTHMAHTHTHTHTYITFQTTHDPWYLCTFVCVFECVCSPQISFLHHLEAELSFPFSYWKLKSHLIMAGKCLHAGKEGWQEPRGRGGLWQSRRQQLQWKHFPKSQHCTENVLNIMMIFFFSGFETFWQTVKLNLNKL